MVCVSFVDYQSFTDFASAVNIPSCFLHFPQFAIIFGLSALFYLLASRASWLSSWLASWLARGLSWAQQLKNASSYDLTTQSSSACSWTHFTCLNCWLSVVLSHSYSCERLNALLLVCCCFFQWWTSHLANKDSSCRFLHQSLLEALRLRNFRWSGGSIRVDSV